MGLIEKFLFSSHRKTAVFAITSQCNARCQMCDMWKTKPKRIPLDKAKEVIDFLVNKKFLVAYFTGGEPTLHPDVAEMIKYAHRQGRITTLTTNGTIRTELLEELCGYLDILSISVDHFDQGVWEKTKGVRGIADLAKRAIRQAKKFEIKTYSLTYLNPHLATGADLEKMVKYVNETLGVPFAFCYPTNATINSFRLGGELSSFHQQSERLKEMALALLKLKKKYKIANPVTYIEDIIRFHENKPPNFYCKGGEGVVYIDWEGNVYPCFNRPKIFNVFKKDGDLLKGTKCNACLINCFREPSIVTQFWLKAIVKEAFNNPAISMYT